MSNNQNAPKKSNATKIIIAVLAICLAVAIGVIIALVAVVPNMDKSSEILDTETVDEIEDDIDEMVLIPAMEDDLWGYVNLDGEFVIEPQFDEAHEFRDDGLAVVMVGYSYGCIDETGEFVIEPQFVYLGNFADNGLAVVQTSEYKWGYINTDGEFVIEPKFEFAGDFADNGLAWAAIGSTYEDYKRGYINTDGEFVLEPQGMKDLRENINFSKNGLLLKYDHDKDKYGYVDADGKDVIEPQFDYAGRFANNGLAWVAVGNETEGYKYGYIDETGEFVIEPQFDYAEDFIDGGTARVYVDDEYAYINEKGEYIIHSEKGKVAKKGIPVNGFIVFGKDSKWGIKDLDGNVVLEPQYDGIFGYSN